MGRIGNVVVGVSAALLSVMVVLQAKSGEPAESTLLSQALSAESEGNAAHAEQLLRQAVATDRGSLPRSTFANFYLRHEDERAWALLAEALAIAIHGGQDVSGIFETAWQFRPDGTFILKNVVGTNPAALNLYTRFLLNTGRVDALCEPAMTIHDEALLLRVSDALLTAGKLQEARTIWDRAVPPRSNGELLTNAELSPPKPFGFDWKFNSVPEAPVTFGDGLRIEFTGRQPSPLEILIQTVPLAPGQYSLTWESRARLEPGAFWQATGAASFRAQIHSAREWQSESSDFEVRNAGAIRLTLFTERRPGTSRFEGTFQLRHPSLRPR